MEQHSEIQEAKECLAKLWRERADFFDSLATGMGYAMQTNNHAVFPRVQLSCTQISKELRENADKLKHQQIASWKQLGHYVLVHDEANALRLQSGLKVITAMEIILKGQNNPESLALVEKIREQKNTLVYTAYDLRAYSPQAKLTGEERVVNAEFAKRYMKDMERIQSEIMPLFDMAGAMQIGVGRQTTEAFKLRRTAAEKKLEHNKVLRQKFMAMLTEAVTPAQTDYVKREFHSQVVQQADTLKTFREQFEAALVEKIQAPPIYENAAIFINGIDDVLISLKKLEYQLRQSPEQARGRY